MRLTLLFPTMPEIPSSLRQIGMIGQKVYDMPGGQVLCTGVGKTIATVMAEHRRTLQPGVCVLLGYAGAIDSCFATGDVVMCKQFCREGQAALDAHKLCHRLAQELRQAGIVVHAGKSYTVDRVIADFTEKLRLAELGGAIVEMENYFAAEAAQRLGIPLVCLRVVFDTLADRLPDLTDTMTAHGELSRGLMLHHLLKTPSHIASLWQLVRAKQIAAPVLASCSRNICKIVGSKL